MQIQKETAELRSSVAECMGEVRSRHQAARAFLGHIRAEHKRHLERLRTLAEQLEEAVEKLRINQAAAFENRRNLRD